MKILSFDISSKSTGYSVIRNGKLIKSSLGLVTTNSKYPFGKRLQLFEEELKELIGKHKPDVVVIEDIFKGINVRAFKTLALFRGVAIKAIYDMMDEDPISIMASRARSLVGVKNKKQKAFDYVIKKFGLKLDFKKDNDIADSIVLGLAYCKMLKNDRTEE